jgi:hypothetical protein
MRFKQDKTDANPAAPRLPFPLPLATTKEKKKCCKKYKKGKRCRKCPNG